MSDVGGGGGGGRGQVGRGEEREGEYKHFSHTLAPIMSNVNSCWWKRKVIRGLGNVKSKGIKPKIFIHTGISVMYMYV